MRFPTVPRCACIVLLALAAGCNGDNPVADDRDELDVLLSSSLIEAVSIEQIESYGLPLTPEAAVDLLRITYRTVDARNNETEASALLAVPSDPPGSLAIASYQHGTIVRKDDVASLRGLDAPEALVAAIFATNGYLGVMPDYLGLGGSEGLHPFVHAASLATAVVDALRAAREFALQEGFDLEDDVYLIGYSEGGYATAAAQKYIEEHLADEFTIGGSAPMAGPLDLANTMVDLLGSDEPYPSPFFLPYALLAYDSVYDLADSPSEFLVEPYHETIPPLFDGAHSAASINALLPEVPKAILPPEFVSRIQTDDDFPWRVRLEENTLLSWGPQSPTRLYHCENDELVPLENSRGALDAFHSNGSPATTVDLVTGDFGSHADCAPVFILLGKFWIDERRTGMPASVGSGKVAETVVRSGWRPIGEITGSDGSPTSP